MLLILSILNPIFLIIALISLVKSLRQVRSSRLEGVLISLGFFLFFFFVRSLDQIAQTPEIFDVYAEGLELSFYMESIAYLGLILCSLYIFKNYGRSFISTTEKILVFLLLVFSLAITAVVSQSLIYYFGATPYTVKASISIGMGLFMGFLLIPTYFNYTRTRFFLPWCRIGIALILLTAVNYLQMVVETRSLGPILQFPTECIRTFCFWFLAIGLITFRRAQIKVTLPDNVFVAKQSWSEKESLEHVFTYLVESLLSLYRAFYGSQNLKGLERKWNRLAEKDHDAMRLEGGELHSVDNNLDLIEQAERLRRYLDLTHGLLVDYCGKLFVFRYLKQLIQELYWTEKDVADLYLFSQLDFGKKFVANEKREEGSIEELLRVNPFFNMLSQSEKDFLKLRFKRKEFRKGKKIIREGAKGDVFFMIAKGECLVLKRQGLRNRPLVCLKEGDTFGEKSLLEDGRRSATVKATTDVVVYWLKKEDFLSVLKSHFEFLPKMKQSYYKVEFLAQIPFFSVFSQIQLLYMATKMKELSFKNGDLVVRQGEKGDSFFLIEAGEAEVVFKNDQGQERSIAQLNKGEFFGEMALLQEGVRTATVKAKSDLICYQLNQSDFNFLFKECHYNKRQLQRWILRREDDLKKKIN